MELSCQKTFFPSVIVRIYSLVGFGRLLENLRVGGESERSWMRVNIRESNIDASAVAQLRV